MQLGFRWLSPPGDVSSAFPPGPPPRPWTLFSNRSFIRPAHLQQIASAEAFGTPTLSGSAAQISPTGILTAEAFGTAAVTTVAATVTPDGVLSQEAFGTLTLQPGLATVSPQAILSAEALGTPEMRVPGTDPIIWDSDPKIAVQARGRLNVAQAAALPVVQQAMVWRSRP